MDYSTLTPPPVGMEETKVGTQTTRNSLYEALQAIPEYQTRSGQTLPVARPDLFVGSGENGRTKHAQRSYRVR